MSQAPDQVGGASTESLRIPGATGAVVRKGSGEQAAAYIRRLIFDGQLNEGNRLPQDEVAKAVGVSRIPIREAIIALEREGWVTTRLHRGTFVNTFDEHVIRDHYELFGLNYGLAARRAAQRANPQVVERLSGLSQQVAITDDPVRLGELAWAFHSAVVEAAHSPRIRVVLRAMSALVPGPFFVLVPRAIEPERKGLRAIVQAIRQRDGDRAAAEYASMLATQAEYVVELFQERRALSAAV
jgi:DNA-binding GntR family transcriptional regulator